METKKTQEEINHLLKLQADYCKRTGLPDFAPKNGICYSCHRQIYQYISEKKASTELITGCPICHRSYCD